MITIYSKDNCAQCKMLKKQLDQNNVAYIEKNIDHDEQALAYVKQMEYKAAPVLESPYENFTGFNPTLLKSVIKKYKDELNAE